MSITSRKKRPLDRTKAYRDARLFVIATEGSQTEPSYFRIFHSSQIQIKILPTDKGNSSPQAVFDRIEEFKKTYSLDQDDELFVVIDTDRWGQQKLSKIAQLCISNNHTLLVSNPCFESWIYFHFCSIGLSSVSCSNVVTEIRKHTSYNKGKLDSSVFNEHNIRQAIENAKAIDKQSDRWPQSFGSKVFLLVEKLLQFCLIPQ